MYRTLDYQTDLIVRGGKIIGAREVAGGTIHLGRH